VQVFLYIVEISNLLAYSASCPRWNGNWVPAKVRWCAAAGDQKAGRFIPFVDKRVGGR